MTNEDKIIELLKSGEDVNLKLAHQLMISLEIKDLDIDKLVNRHGQWNYSVLDGTCFVINRLGVKFSNDINSNFFNGYTNSLDIMKRLNIEEHQYNEYYFKELKDYQITGLLLESMKCLDEE